MADDIIEEWRKFIEKRGMSQTPRIKQLLKFLEQKNVPYEEVERAVEKDHPHISLDNHGRVMSRDDSEKLIETIMGIERDIQDSEEELREEMEEEVRRLENEKERAQNSQEELQEEERELERKSREIEESVEEAERELDEEENKAKKWMKKGKNAAEKGAQAAGSAAAGAKNAYDKKRKKRKLDKLRENWMNKNSDSSNGGALKEFIMFLALAIPHYVLSIGVAGGSWNVFWMGVVITLFLAGYYSVQYNSRQIWGVALAEIFGVLGINWLVGLGGVNNMLPASIASLFTILWWCTPLLAIYVGSQLNWWPTRLWALAIVGLMIMWLVHDLGLRNFFPQLAAEQNLAQASGQAWEDLKSAFNNLIDVFKSGMESLVGAGQRSINYATGGYYTSVVEQQQGEDIGLAIDDFRAVSDVFFQGQEVFLWADITGKTFKEKISVSTHCFTEEKEGSTSPSTFEIFAEGGESVRCTFQNLSEGSHTVNFQAGFPFSTWGYVTYTFVEQQTKYNILSQDKNINRELDIPSTVKPTYTPGPVRLEMAADIPQPVGIDTSNGLNAPFGARLTNKWTEGRIDEVSHFIVLTPPEFRLFDCDAQKEELLEDPYCEVDRDRCAENMNAYRFSVNPGRQLQQIGCRVGLSGGTDPSEVIPPGQQKMQKTFVVRAEYDYILEERETVEVRERYAES